MNVWSYYKELNPEELNKDYTRKQKPNLIELLSNNNSKKEVISNNSSKNNKENLKKKR